MNLFDVYPLFDLEISSGKGSRVYDDRGASYLDLYGGHAVISIGHSHPHYIAKISEQLQKIGFYSNSVRMASQRQLCEKLGSVSGKSDYQLFLCNSGAEANENALKLASFHTGKKHILAFKNSFHGRTSLAVEVTDNPSIQAPVNHTGNVTFLPLNDPQALEQAFQDKEVCAVILEGIQGVGGIHVATEAFLKKVRALCDQHGAVFIADGVQCGYGRSGKFFSHDFAGVNADIYSMAKGMGNGFPIGGILISPSILPKYGMLGTTFGGNQLACAAAIAVLDVIEEEALIDNAGRVGAYLIEELRKLEGIREVRGRGLMIGLSLPFDSAELRKRLLYTYRVFTGSANEKSMIRLLPALSFSKAEAEEFLGIFKTALAEQFNLQKTEVLV